LLAGSIGVYSATGPLRRYVLKIFDRRAARLLDENPWHPSQRIEPQPGDSWRLTLDLTSDRELLPRVLAMGPAAEVMEPDSFRAAVAQTLRQAVTNYSGPDVTEVRGRLSWKKRGRSSQAAERRGT
jgi:predicted DNA-binding transcriptional regulator YafY